jgi:hypothetical protein
MIEVIDTKSFAWEMKGLPKGWKVVEKRQDGIMWVNANLGFSVIVSFSREGDGKRWAHLSIAHKSRIPTYTELKYLKDNWLGPHKKCIMLFPEESKHVNIHPYCLHLFHCLDDDGLPDFTGGNETL